MPTDEEIRMNIDNGSYSPGDEIFFSRYLDRKESIRRREGDLRKLYGNKLLAFRKENPYSVVACGENPREVCAELEKNGISFEEVMIDTLDGALSEMLEIDFARVAE